MLVKIALLCALAASVQGLWTPNIKVRFGGLPYNDHFVKMAKDIDEAINMNWVKKDRPTGPAGLKSLEMWCPPADYSFCTLVDDTGYPAGVQIAVDKSKIKLHFDAATTGFTSWTTTLNGKSIDYHTIQIYFISEEALKTSKQSRVAARKAGSMLHYDSIWLTGFNGKLHALSLDSSLLGTDKSDYTKQACVPWMGQHYYYKMSNETTCTAETLFPWFPLEDSKQCIGAGFMTFGKYEVAANTTDYFEHPDRPAVQAIVNKGPKCLYELAEQGVLTMHVYFIDSPRQVLCPLW